MFKFAIVVLVFSLLVGVVAALFTKQSPE